MASTTANKVGHIERTAAEPRDKASHLTSWIWVAFHSHLSQSLFTVVLRKIDEVNDQVRLFHLEIPLDGPQLRVNNQIHSIC